MSLVILALLSGCGLKSNKTVKPDAVHAAGTEAVQSDAETPRETIVAPSQEANSPNLEGAEFEPATTEPPTRTGVAESSAVLRAAITASETTGGGEPLGTTHIVVPPDTHQVHAADYGGDWNAYPAENAVVLQGTVEGPLGDQDWALLWVTASRPDFQPEVLPQVEVVLVRPPLDDPEANDFAVVQAIQGPLGASDPGLLVLGVHTLEIADTDGDGRYEALLDVVYEPCCGEKRTPIEERVMLRLSNGEFTVSAAPPSRKP